MVRLKADTTYEAVATIRLKPDTTDDRLRSITDLRHRFVGDLQRTVDDRERVAQLRFRDAQRRVREEGVPAHERVEPFLPEELAERRHLVRRAVERGERNFLRA